MRMWMVNPKILCNKHLFGEHVETHMFVGTLKKKIKVNGYFTSNCFEPLSLKSRHEDLVVEIFRRSYNHQSPLTINDNLFDHLDNDQLTIKVDSCLSLKDLLSRCPLCLHNYNEM